MEELVTGDGGGLAVESPLDYVHSLLKTEVRVKLRQGRTLVGRLVGYDEHLNLMLKDLKEFVSKGEASSGETVVFEHQITYVRGDLVVTLGATVG